MANEIEVHDIFDEVGDDDSEIASSGDEYIPHLSDVSDSEEETAGSLTSKGPRVGTKANKRKRKLSSDDSDDDIPLSTLKQKLMSYVSKTIWTSFRKCYRSLRGNMFQSHRWIHLSKT